MTPLQQLAYSILLLLAGWHLRGIIGGAWRRVRSPHRFGDAAHFWCELDGRTLALTDDQLDTAEARAQHRQDPRRRYLLAALVTLLYAVLFGLLLTGCGRRESALTTGAVCTSAQVRAALPGFAGDTAYAIVRSEALPDLYANFRSVLSDQGLVKWDARYDCNHFAALYVSLSQAKFTVAAWHSEIPAQTLALAEIWFRPGNGSSGHAIVAAATERGLVFIEPQTGRELTLTPAERASIYLCKW